MSTSKRTARSPPAQLTELEPSDVAGILGQDPDHELMRLYASSLNDLGVRLRDAGGVIAVIDAADGSATAFARRVGSWDCFADSSRYDELTVPFRKRAQIAAADLHRAGCVRFTDLDRLTLFADNLVPHVLRLDGVLAFEPGLVARIEAEQLIVHDSPEEVEIRACALHAVELIVAELRRMGEARHRRRRRPDAVEPWAAAALQGGAAASQPLHRLLSRDGLSPRRRCRRSSRRRASW